MFKGLKSLLAGLIAGTALGILFAPKKGETIRKEFKKEIKEGGIGLNTVKNTLVGMGEDIGGTIKNTETFQKGEKSLGNYLKKAKKGAKDAIHSMAEKLKRND